ncbi:exopolygalacturonase-like [Impatiens glandulifera]|uniref:exopolygalacturonase-like n=1 Tax=Impatiens glandulifera TaxID=253017 RepID=UPI001FB133A6|nr:exopolygalacturonase-like [Impatiens glandulifera]
MAGWGRRASLEIALFLVLLLCIIHEDVAAARIRRPRPAGAEKVFNVMRFGAKKGGSIDCTQAFADTWIAACRGPLSKGINTRVVVPNGVFLVSASLFEGPCTATGIVFEIRGTIQADTDISNYPNNAWLGWDTVDNMLIAGSGTIDGQGQKVWEYNDCKTNPNCIHLPSAVHFDDITNSMIRNIHVQNAMGFNLHIVNSKSVRVKNVRIIAPGKSPNTDGVHISKSSNVSIDNSFIGTGDDCISLGPGSIDVSINNLICGPGHGISIGSLGKGPDEMDVTGIKVKNCTLVGTTNGLRIKTWPGSPPSNARDMVFSDITMKDVMNPIIIDQGYGGGDPVSKPSKVQVSDIVFENVKGTSGSEVAVNLMCSKAVPCSNVQLNNIQLTKALAAREITSSCVNAKVGYSGAQLPPAC